MKNYFRYLFLLTVLQLKNNKQEPHYKENEIFHRKTISIKKYFSIILKRIYFNHYSPEMVFNTSPMTDYKNNFPSKAFN